MLFRCRQCSRLIGEFEPVFMREDAAFCSSSCRLRSAYLGADEQVGANEALPSGCRQASCDMYPPWPEPLRRPREMPGKQPSRGKNLSEAALSTCSSHTASSGASRWGREVQRGAASILLGRVMDVALATMPWCWLLRAMDALDPDVWLVAPEAPLGSKLTMMPDVPKEHHWLPSPSLGSCHDGDSLHPTESSCTLR